MLSPVIGAWSTLDCPVVSKPSRAIRSPGATRASAPGATAPISTLRQLPSGCRMVACGGASAIRP